MKSSFESLESRLLLSADPLTLPQLVDDGADGFTTGGTWTAVEGDGMEGDSLVSKAGQDATAVWTFDDLTPGYQYRVSASWDADSAAATDAEYTVSSSANADTEWVLGTASVDQTAAPNDFAESGTVWEDLGSPYLVRGTSLSVSLTNPDGSPISADAIRIQRVGEWIAPIGIVTPEFGINESHWMYSEPGATYNYGNGSEAYRMGDDGPYTHYVDNSHANATDSNNPFGTPDKPRKTIPTDVAAGSVVEVHGSFSSDLDFDGNGSAAKPVFLRGTRDDIPVFDLEASIGGQYVIMENIEVTDNQLNMSGRPDHMSMRNLEVHGFTPGGNGNTINTIGYDLVLYNSHVHHNGDATLDREHDIHGAKPRGENIWIVDNLMHENGGDSVQVKGSDNDADDSQYIYIGRNVMFGDRENAIDIKGSRHVIVSQNTIYGYVPTSGTGSDGAAIVGGHEGAELSWFLFNEIYDSNRGIRINDKVVDTEAYVIGNVIHDIDGEAIYTHFPNTLYVVNNVVYNSGSGFDGDNGGSDYHIYNNIFANLDNHLVVERPSYSEAHHNLYYQDGGSIDIVWGSGDYSSVSAFQSSTGEGEGSFEADPMFVNINGDDVRLTPGSPALDAGTDIDYLVSLFKSLYGVDIAADMLGMPRPQGSGVDLGAYEGTTSDIPNEDNNAPVATGAEISTEEDKAVSGSLSATDVDGDPLNFMLAGNATNGSVALNNNGTFTYTPKANWFGTDSFSFRAFDGWEFSAPATVTITVSPVEDAPTATDDSATTEAGQSVIVDVLANDFDAEGDAISLTSFTQPANGTVASGANGALTYTPNAGWAGVDTFTYTIEDAGGTTGSANVTIMVSPPELPGDILDIAGVSASSYEDGNAPAGAIDGSISTRWSAEGDGQWIQFDLGQVANVNKIKAAWLKGDSRASMFDVLVSADGANWTTVFIGESSGQSAGLETHILAETAGRYVRVVGHGNTDNDWNSLTEVEIFGRDANVIPLVAVNDSATGSEDSSIVIDVLANDIAVTGGLNLTSFTQPTHGEITANGDGTLTYTPDENWNGTDSFNYFVRDDGGSTGTADVELTVTPVNDAPIAQDDVLATTQGVAATVDVLANDSDVDGDSITIESFTQPGHSEVVQNGDGTLSYIPNADYVGTDSFTYTVGDGQGGSDTATVNVTINGDGETPLDRLHIANVVAASNEAGNTADNTVDGDLSTRWSALGDGAWIQYDLGGIQTVERVDIGWLKGDKRVASFEIQVSTDGENWASVYEGQSSGTTAELESYGFDATAAQYVRIVGYGNTRNDWNSICETEIYGQQSSYQRVELEVESVTATESEAPNVAANVLDGDLSTRWSAKGDGQSITFDLGSAQTVNEVQIDWLKGNRRIAYFDIEISLNGSDWTTVFSGQSSGTDADAEVNSFGASSAQYVRIVGRGNSVNDWNSIVEVELFGLETL